MANFTKTFISEDPANYTFDSLLIDWPSLGTQPKLKESSLFNPLGLYLRAKNDATDSSNAGVTTTPTDDTYTAGKIDTAMLFNGSTTKVSFPDFIAPSGDISCGFSFWARQDSTGVQHIFTYSTASKFFRFDFRDQNQLRFSTNSQSKNIFTDLSVWKHYVFNINENGTTEIIIDNVSAGTLATNALTFLAPSGVFLGTGRDGATGAFNGLVEQFLFKPSNFTPSEISDLYNSGAGRVVHKYSPDSPTIRQNTPSTDAQLVQYQGYSMSTAGAGAVGIRLSKDNYTTTEYYDGGSWVPSPTLFNGVATVNTNISTFSATEQQISTEIAFISDGFTQIELIAEQVNYAVNQAPTVNAGLNKPIGGGAVITDVDNFAPSSDGIASDPDAGGYIAQILISANGGAFENIPQGVFASLVEAWNNKQYNASLFGTGTFPFVTKVIDNLGAEAQDTVLVTIVDSLDSTVNDTNVKVTQLLADLASVDTKVDTLTANVSAVDANVEDVHDIHLGESQEVTGTGLITMKRKNGTVLATFQGTDITDAETSQSITKRVKL